MEKSFVFNSINGDRRYRAEDFRDYFASFVGNGVFPNPSTTLQVISNDDMTVTVKAGKGWINGAIYYNTENLILRVDNADGVLNRIDRVILRFDNLERNITCKIKKGIFASIPVPQQLQRDMDAYELCLAEIYVGKGDTSVLQSKITDTRLNSELCGIVTQIIKEIDTTELFKKLDGFIEERGKDVKYWMDQSTNKWEMDFNEWFDTIKDILDSDVAGALTNRILKLENTTKNHTSEIEKLKDKVENGLKADNMQMADGNSVQTNYNTLKDTVDKGQKHKLTSDNGTAQLLNAGYNLDSLTKAGVYNGEKFTNAPKGNQGWWYIEVIQHTNLNGFCYQKATSLSDFNNIRVFHRQQVGNTWGPWRLL